MTKLLITNLPADITGGDLEDLFTTVGDVVRVHVEAAGGVGRVEMASESAARDAIERFNGIVKSGHRLAVREDRPHVATVRPSKALARKLAIKAGLIVSNSQKQKAKAKECI